MKVIHKILVTDHLQKNSLVTREIAIAFMENLRATPYYDIQVDFTGVNFISRSFADQFHKDKIALWERGEKNVVVVNANDDVLEMFKAVCKTQKEVTRHYESYPLVHFQSRRSLKDFLQSI